MGVYGSVGRAVSTCPDKGVDGCGESGAWVMGG